MPTDATSAAARALGRKRWQKITPEQRAALQAAARDGLNQRFLNEVDPERTLSVEEQKRRVVAARSAFFRGIRRSPRHPVRVKDASST